MKQILLILAVVMGQSVLAADKKPLTKEESAKRIEAAIRKKTKKPTGELTKADLEYVTNLSLGSYAPFINKLTEVKGLEKLAQLKVLHLTSNHLTDVKDLEKLAQLTYLDLDHNKLTDVKGLEKLTQLGYLNLNYNKLTSIKGLEKLTKLTQLSLAATQLTDVKGLEKLTKLMILNLEHNPELTKAQIAELQKALPKCKILSNPKK